MFPQVYEQFIFLNGHRKTSQIGNGWSIAHPSPVIKLTSVGRALQHITRCIECGALVRAFHPYCGIFIFSEAKHANGEQQCFISNYDERAIRRARSLPEILLPDPQAILFHFPWNVFGGCTTRTQQGDSCCRNTGGAQGPDEFSPFHYNDSRNLMRWDLSVAVNC